MSKWLGEAEQNVAKLFAAARNSAKQGHPAIVFIDELDSLIGMHSSEVGGEARVRNQFLKEMDGIMDKGRKHPCLCNWIHQQTMGLGLAVHTKISEANLCSST